MNSEHVREMVDLVVQQLSREPGEPREQVPAREDETTQRLGVLSLVLGGAAFLAVATNAFLGAVLSLETETVMTGRALAPGLEALIFRCLEKSPADRPQTMKELADELRACARELGAHWTAEDAARWWSELPVDKANPQPEDTARKETISWDLQPALL